MKKEKSKKYRVLRRIWHSGEHRGVEPGEVVSLDHLNEKKIEFLVKSGVVEPVAEEVKDEPGASK